MEKLTRLFDNSRWGRSASLIISKTIETESDLTRVPDKAKLDRAKPPVRIVTTSHGGKPKSKEERIIQVAGDKKAIV